MNTPNDQILSDLVEARERLIERGAAGLSSFYGCSESEVEQVQAEAGLPLPRAYIEFLREMGRGAGRFFEGTDMFFPTMFQNTEAAREMLDELANGLELPEGSFVFAMHQGYQFFFFHEQDDNPSVSYYMEGNTGFDLWNDTFTGFIKQMAANEW